MSELPDDRYNLDMKAPGARVRVLTRNSHGKTMASNSDKGGMGAALSSILLHRQQGRRRTFGV